MIEEPNREHPLISVCIPTYNRAHYIGDALASVLSQTFQDYELLIIDDHSDDHTAEVVASFQDERIRFLRNDWNLGNPQNHNRCILEARGDYIKFLHSDDRFLTDSALQLMADAAANYPDAAVITCGFKYDNETGSYCLPFDLYRPKGFSTVRACMNIHSFGLPSELLIKKEAFSYTGMLIDSVINDVDLVLKMTYSFNSYTIAETLVEHRLHNKSETTLHSWLNGWEFLRFTALEQVPFYVKLSAEQKTILSNYLHISLLNKIKSFIQKGAYHYALQGVMDLLKVDSNLRCYREEDREKALQLLLDGLVYRKSPYDIIDVMIGQKYSKPYRDLFRYGTAFDYRLYLLEQEWTKANKSIYVIGAGRWAQQFLQAFPQLKGRVVSIIATDNDNSGVESIEGIPVSDSLSVHVDLAEIFPVLASEAAIRKHRYELIRAGFLEGEHFVPMVELN